mmetsp:Transcript_45111/g.96786  ORF Transcript_45111/g.96786 Transcript_45111/m.96786 type:complete len:268 (+) Transcript_45111:518-1321(+)
MFDDSDLITDEGFAFDIEALRAHQEESARRFVVAGSVAKGVELKLQVFVACRCEGRAQKRLECLVVAYCQGSVLGFGDSLRDSADAPLDAADHRSAKHGRLLLRDFCGILDVQGSRHLWRQGRDHRRRDVQNFQLDGQFRRHTLQDGYLCRAPLRQGREVSVEGEAATGDGEAEGERAVGGRQERTHAPGAAATLPLQPQRQLQRTQAGRREWETSQIIGPCLSKHIEIDFSCPIDTTGEGRHGKVHILLALFCHSLELCALLLEAR